MKALAVIGITFGLVGLALPPHGGWQDAGLIICIALCSLNLVIAVRT